MVVAGAMARFSASRQRILPSDGGSGSQGDDFTDQLVAITLSGTVFGFLGSGHGSAESSGSESSNSRFDDQIEEEEEEEDEDGNSSERSKVFWESQHKLLKETLCKSSSLEREMRNAAKMAMKVVRNEGKFCVCGGDEGSCRSCLLREMSRRLCDAGYNSAVCKSKWRSSPEIPSGEHTFIDVVDNSNEKKGQVRIIIELGFRAEFEMARASQEYKELVARLPEAFVGKAERLRALIKIMSSAAKRCMKDKKMHMGPWRKSKYMLAKWSATSHRIQNDHKPLPSLPTYHPNKLSSRPKASMLTIALHHQGSRVQPKVVTVV